MKPAAQNILTTLITTLGIIITGYFTVLPTILENRVEDASEAVSNDMAIENRKLMEQWKRDAEKREDSLWNVGLQYMQKIDKKSTKPPAIVVRSDSGEYTYNTSYDKLQPTWWQDQYKWWMYTDLRDGEKHGVFYEKHVSLQEMKYRAKIMFDEEFLNQKIDDRIEKYHR